MMSTIKDPHYKDVGMPQRISRRGIAPFPATAILMAAVLIAAIAILGFTTGLFGTFTGGVGATVNPEIYAPGQNIGVLNQNATFLISVGNNRSTPIAGTVVLTAGATAVRNQSFTLAPGKSQEFTLSTPLFTTGEWTITVTVSDGTVLHPYSFIVEQNEDAANSQLTADNLAQEHTLLLIVGPLVAAVIGVIPGGYSLYLRRKDRLEKVMVVRFRVGAYWFIRVRCMKDWISKCSVFCGDRILAVKDSPGQERFEVSLTAGDGENFGFEGAVPVPENDPTEIKVMDEDHLIFRRPFKDLTWVPE